MKPSLLIVDDSKVIHDLIVSSLDGDGYQVFHAYSGIDGIDLAAAHLPDLTLLDVDLPDMNGFDVCRHIKSNSVTSHLLVIFLTAYGSADERICGLQLDAADYITKPFDPSELSLRVRSALRMRRLSTLLDPAGEPGESDPATLNPHLSLGQIMAARSRNPWQRVPPGGETRPSHIA